MIFVHIRLSFFLDKKAPLSVLQGEEFKKGTLMVNKIHAAEITQFTLLMCRIKGQV